MIWLMFDWTNRFDLYLVGWVAFIGVVCVNWLRFLNPNDLELYCPPYLYLYILGVLSKCLIPGYIIDSSKAYSDSEALVKTNHKNKLITMNRFAFVYQFVYSTLRAIFNEQRIFTCVWNSYGITVLSTTWFYLSNYLDRDSTRKNYHRKIA